MLSLFVPSLYLFANLFASGFTAAKKGFRYYPLLPFVFATLHIGYGMGFLAGLLKFWNRWGDQIGAVPAFVPAGAAQGFQLTVREIEVAAGAGFVTPICGTSPR